MAPYPAIDPEEYFTISKHGVTHVLNKEADFEPLADWERDYIMFQKLAKVRTDRCCKNYQLVDGGTGCRAWALTFPMLQKVISGTL